MLPTPTKFSLVAGCGEAENKLNAFDNALLEAGIGNLNLLKVSSIMPPGAKQVENLKIPPGSLVPTAYGSIYSDIPGEVIAAAVAIGFSEDTFGVIMEFSGKCTKEEAEETVLEMVRDDFRQRGMRLVDIKSKAIDHKVEKVGCSFAAVALWY